MSRRSTIDDRGSHHDDRHNIHFACIARVSFEKILNNYDFCWFITLVWSQCTHFTDLRERETDLRDGKRDDNKSRRIKSVFNFVVNSTWRAVARALSISLSLSCSRWLRWRRVWDGGGRSEWGLRSGLNEYDLAVVPRHVLHVLWASHLNVAAQRNGQTSKQAHDLCPSMRESWPSSRICRNTYRFFGSSFFLIFIDFVMALSPVPPLPLSLSLSTQLTVGFLRLFTHARDSISKFLLWIWHAFHCAQTDGRTGGRTLDELKMDRALGRDLQSCIWSRPVNGAPHPTPHAVAGSSPRPPLDFPLPLAWLIKRLTNDLTFPFRQMLWHEHFHCHFPFPFHCRIRHNSLLTAHAGSTLQHKLISRFEVILPSE